MYEIILYDTEDGRRPVQELLVLPLLINSTF
jgi:hypothetical protein